MVKLNRAQCAALKQLIAKVDIEELTLASATDDEVVLSLRGINGSERKLMLDKWGQGRLAA